VKNQRPWLSERDTLDMPGLSSYRRRGSKVTKHRNSAIPFSLAQSRRRPHTKVDMCWWSKPFPVQSVKRQPVSFFAYSMRHSSHLVQMLLSSKGVAIQLKPLAICQERPMCSILRLRGSTEATSCSMYSSTVDFIRQVSAVATDL
jgi:hypothetical protein